MEKKVKKIFIALLFSSFFLLLTLTALAGYKLEVGIPDQPKAAAGEEVDLSDYIRYIYLFALGAVGVAALGTLVVAGLIYMLSDLVTNTEEAKKYIWGAVWGLLLALAAYLILYTINPDLIRLRSPNLDDPSSSSSTSSSDDSGTTSSDDSDSTGSLPTAEPAACTAEDCPSECEEACPDEYYWDPSLCYCTFGGGTAF